MATDYAEFIGVYDDERTARDAAEAAVEAGAEAGSVRIDSPADEREALRSEMREESEHTIAGPGNVGPFTKEMTKGVAVGVPVATVIGAVIGLVLGLIPWANVGLVFRIVVGMACGAFAGAVVGFYGGALAAKGPAERLAAERGVTMRLVVRCDNADAVAAKLSSFSPIRLDVEDRNEWATVTTEEDQDGSGIVETLGHRLVQTDGDWSGALRDEETKQTPRS